MFYVPILVLVIELLGLKPFNLVIRRGRLSWFGQWTCWT